MKLSIIIPVYNEESTINDVIKQVLAVDLPGIEKEIIVVDDGSTDTTAEILKREQQKNADIVKIHTSQQNFGKGMAIRMGLNYVTGDTVLIQDADLEYDPKNYLNLISPIQSNETSVVYGSRFLNTSNRIYWGSRLVPKILNPLTNFLYCSYVTDIATGYKVFKAEILKGIELRCTGFEFEFEITAKLLKRGYRIVEVPITYRSRSKAEGKKVRYLRDGPIAIYTLLKYRFVD